MRNHRLKSPLAVPLAISMAIAMTIGLVGCGDGTSTDETRSAENSAATSEENRSAEAETAATETERSATAMTENQTGGPIDVVESQEYGRYIADSEGRAVYLLEADSQGRSTCYDECADTWPPLEAEQEQIRTVSAGQQQNMLGTIERDDGTLQVTYNGHPLYYYEKDDGPSEVSGQDVQDEWGEWYLVTPAGEKLEESSEGASY